MYYVEKTKVLISSVVAMQLICIFVLVYAKSKFCYDAAQMYIKEKLLNNLSIFRAELSI